MSNPFQDDPDIRKQCIEAYEDFLRGDKPATLRDVYRKCPEDFLRSTGLLGAGHGQYPIVLDSGIKSVGRKVWFEKGCSSPFFVEYLSGEDAQMRLRHSIIFLDGVPVWVEGVERHVIGDILYVTPPNGGMYVVPAFDHRLNARPISPQYLKPNGFSSLTGPAFLCRNPTKQQKQGSDGRNTIFRRPFRQEWFTAPLGAGFLKTVLEEPSVQWSEAILPMFQTYNVVDTFRLSPTLALAVPGKDTEERSEVSLFFRGSKAGEFDLASRTFKTTPLYQSHITFRDDAALLGIPIGGVL